MSQNVYNRRKRYCFNGKAGEQKMNKKVRLADIAEAIGVSTVTVSKALSGKEGVSETVREKIQQIAQEMGYQPKSSASRGMDDDLIGILVYEHFLNVSHSFYWHLYERVLEHLRVHNMFGILEIIRADDARALHPPLLLQNDRVQALILLGDMNPAYLRMIQQKTLPVVQLDSYDIRLGWDAVISDGYYGMYTMTDYLIQRGHREIAYLGLVGETHSITDRYFGYNRALQENAIPLHPEWVLADRDEQGQTCITLPPQMPTAFVCNCDVTAYHLIALLHEQGLRVPEDVSVVGFDNFCFPNFPDFQITTYAVDMDGMAQACVNQLIYRLTAPQERRQLQIVSGYLVERASVCRL